MRLHVLPLLLLLVCCGGAPHPAPPTPDDVSQVYSAAIDGQLLGYIKDGARVVLVARETVAAACPAPAELMRITPLTPPFTSVYRVDLVDDASIDVTQIWQQHPDSAGLAELSGIAFDATHTHAQLFFRHNREPGWIVQLEKRFNRWWDNGATPCGPRPPPAPPVR